MDNRKQTHTERQSTKEVVPTLKCGCYERQTKIAELFLVRAFQRNGKSKTLQNMLWRTDRKPRYALD